MNLFCKKIRDSSIFNNFIIFVILMAGVLVGLQTYKSFYAENEIIFNIIDKSILIIFTLEVIIKILAEGNKPFNFFRSGWNIFDFTIVVLCLGEPFFAESAVFLPVLRLIRVLRVLRLVTAIPKLQLIVGTLLRSLPSMFYVGILLSLIFYIYGTMGVFIFADNDPIHFRNLQTSLLTLFSINTLEGWADIFYINYYGSDKFGYSDEDILNWKPSSSAMPLVSVLFFISFICIGTMIVLNLVIGVIMNSMNEMNDEMTQSDDKAAMLGVSGDLSLKLDDIEQRLSNLSKDFSKIKDSIKKY
ncbi:MAG: ion transporter [Opitutales bacterium]